MADWKKKRRATRMKGSPGLDPCFEQDAEYEHDVIMSCRNNYPTATSRPVNFENMPTLGSLLQSHPRSHQKQDPMESPTTPFAFVPSPVRQPFYSHTVNGKIHKLYDPTDSPTTPTTPSSLGSPAKRPSHRTQSNMNGRVMKHAKIQKPSFGRSQSFGGKYGYRGQHMDSLQSQLYSTMRTLGVDEETAVERLDRLKEVYLSRCEQSRPDSPLSGSQPPVPADDHRAQVSTIALLKHKFAQFERFKESTQCQQIPLYPNQNYHGGQSPSSQRSTPTSSSCSPSVATTSDSSYEFDETTATLLALQQEMMWTSFNRSTASGNSDVSNSSDSIASWSSPNWYARGGNSPTSSINFAPRRDEGPDVVAPHQKLPPLKGRRHSNLGSPQDASHRGAKMGDPGPGGFGADTLVNLFAAENLATTKPASKYTDREKKIAISIEMAMAKLSFNLSTNKLSSPKYRVQGEPRGTGLSASYFGDHPARGPCEVTETWRNNVQSSINEVEYLDSSLECPDSSSLDSSMEHPDSIDTSLRL